MGKPRGSGRLLTGAVAILMATAACTSGASSAPSTGGGASVAPSTGGAASASVAASTGAGASASAAASTEAVSAANFKIGYSNGGGVGNGFREEQVCTAKAQAPRRAATRSPTSPSSIATRTQPASCPTSGP